MDGAFTIIVREPDAGRRLDSVVALHLPGCSRSLAAALIGSHQILVGEQPKKPGYRTKAGDRIQGCIPEPAPTEYQPESIPLDILYRDESIIVINKQPGLVVHPAPGHSCGTLVNALLHHCPDIGAVGGEIRPGIVHRLDKDTSGIMVVAKHAAALEELARQFKDRKIRKRYLALVYGDVQPDAGEIQLPIGRHPIDRKRMSATTRKSREAITLWRVHERLNGITLLELDLKTGRTHQIRVHCSSIGYPVVGDPVYRPRKISRIIDELLSVHPRTVIDFVKSIDRQMLHAWKLSLVHPQHGRKMTFEAPLPADMQGLIARLKGEGRGF